MKYSVDILHGPDLELAYHLATDFTGFEYLPSLKCWKAEKQISELGINLAVVINDVGFVPTIKTLAYQRRLEVQEILLLMREENIALSWTTDKEFRLFFQALPEIESIDRSLEIAFMRVIVKKELGVITDEHVEAMNVMKTKTTDKLF